MASSINKISETTNHSRMRIPNLGWVRMRESLRFTGKLLSATVSRVADRWFVSPTADTEDSPKRRTENQGATGVDLGVSALATFSTGEKVVGPKPHKALLKRLKRLKRLSRSLSRKHKAAKGKLGLVANAPIPKGVRLPVSENTKKARAELSRFHARIANIRADALHKLTSEVTRRFPTIGIEDLNGRGMMANRPLARSMADMGFFEFRRQLAYKAERRGGLVAWWPTAGFRAARPARTADRCKKTCRCPYGNGCARTVVQATTGT